MQMLRRALEAYGNRPVLGEEQAQGDGDFHWLLYGEMLKQVDSVVDALLWLGIEPGHYVALSGSNTVQHAVVKFGVDL